MASNVDICNLALSHLGDSATVSSIDPPEGSAQAEHCARFYSSTLAALMEMQPWSFSTYRVALPAVTNPSSTWAYAYALPADAVNLIAVLAPDASNDYSASIVSTSNYDGIGQPPATGYYTPQNFVVETSLSSGDQILLTNQPNAVLRYSGIQTDTSQFTPLFVEAFSWLLATKLAGPVIKGVEGIKMAQACMQAFQYWYGQACDSDSSQRQVKPVQQVGWMNAR